jgi:D-arginine dehydrogenase
MTAFDVVVVGGGVAGLSAIAQLARGGSRAVLLERESLLAAHASGRNAAIYRPLEHDASTAALARRSLELIAQLADEPLLAGSGLLLASAEPDEIARLCARAAAERVPCERLEGAALVRAAGSLAGSDVGHGVLVPEGGVLDIHALNGALARAARAAGAEIRVGAGVRGIVTSRGRACGVSLLDGTQVAAGAVVLAAGAWNAQLGAECGAPLPLTPVRRHLVQLLSDAPLPAGHPVVWRLDDELYYRAESSGVLASPCDAVPWPPCAPPSEPAALELLAAKLQRTAPALASAQVRAAWACLRTFAPDRELCLGEDPRVAGLWWFGGLGGRGMAVAPAAGELLAAAMRGQAPIRPALSPNRLLA